LGRLVDLCLQAGISRIYISSDGPKSHSDRDDVRRVEKEIARLITLHTGKIFVKASNQNLGSAVNVLSACDWVFSQEYFVVVLEDDCIPSIGFFSFVEDSKQIAANSESVFMICGTQLVPISITGAQPCLSVYPMVWGWATSREKWLSLSEVILNTTKKDFSIFKLSSNDITYWRAGARRATEGYVDAWDTPLVYAIRRLGGRVIAPGVNLISNIGGDGFATHTVDGSKWLEQEVGQYSASGFPIRDNLSVDEWIKKKVFTISARHQFSVRYTWLLDKTGYHKTIRKSFKKRRRENAFCYFR
jgi:hypothetical protein